MSSRAAPWHASPLVRLLGTLAVTGLCTAYIVWKIDLGETVDVLRQVELAPVALALAILIAVIVPLAWRWQLLLRSSGVDDRLGWLTRAYFVSYTAGQILPTSLGGDAFRIFETGRRHPGHRGVAAATVVLERGLGGVATLTLGAVGFLLAIGRYDVGPYLWIEALLAVLMLAIVTLFFSRSARRLLRQLEPVLRRLRLAGPLRVFYEEVHAFRARPRLLVGLFGLTLAVQALRVLCIWLAGVAAGVDLPALPYFVMGPVFFVIMLFPLTLNGFALREAFFVSFLGELGVSPDAAFATGLLYFALSLGLALPGAVILAWEAVRAYRSPAARAEAARRSSD